MADVSAGVIGAGVMGSGIAQTLAVAGSRRSAPTSMRRRSSEGARTPCRAAMGSSARSRAASSRAPTPTPRSRGSSSRRRSTRRSTCDVIVECVPERLDLKLQVFRDLDARAKPGRDPRLEHLGLPDHGARGGHEPARPRDRLALGIAAADHAARRDRHGAEDLRRHHAAHLRAREALRQEPDRGEGLPDAVGLRREPDLLRDGDGSPARRGSRGSPSHEDVNQLHGRLLQLAGRAVRDGARRDRGLEGVESDASQGVRGSMARRRRGKRAQTEAEQADLYDLYEAAVQDPEGDVALLQRMYRTHYDRDPHTLREDFCGSAAMCCAWVKADPHNRAFGIDIDPAPLAWARKHSFPKLGAGALRARAAAPGRRARGEARGGRRDGRLQLLLLHLPGARRPARLLPARARARAARAVRDRPLRRRGLAAHAHRVARPRRRSTTSGTRTCSTRSTTAPSTTSTSTSRTAAGSSARSATTGGSGASRSCATCCTTPASPAPRPTGSAPTARPTRARRLLPRERAPDDPAWVAYIAALP